VYEGSVRLVKWAEIDFCSIVCHLSSAFESLFALCIKRLEVGKENLKMAIWVAVNLASGYGLPLPNRPSNLPRKTSSGGVLSFELDDDNTWRLRAPYHPEWRYYLPYPSGKWSRSNLAYEDTYIQDTEGSKTYFTLRSLTEKPSGFAFMNDVSNQSNSSWTRIAKPLPVRGRSGCWAGLAVKGSLGAGVGGEDTFGAVVSFDNSSEGFIFNFNAGRILTAGFSAGAAFVLITGFERARDIHNHLFAGTDWTISVGAKAGALAKVKGIGKIMEAIAGIGSKADGVVKVVGKNAKELVGAGKGVYQSGAYDWEEESLNIIDIPLAGAGAEVGWYWYAGTCHVVTEWNPQSGQAPPLPNQRRQAAGVDSAPRGGYRER
jgi:hypothetical protein